ncbi:MAG: hypothetical protein JWR20_1937 [Marmoricola sp.]|nr:hypothetical protein [Marmoricola sp.]
MSGATLWEQFTLDPRQAQHQHLRASDRDRDLAREHLLTAYAEGRLDEDEVDERTATLASSRTLGELVPLLQDVVVPPAPGTVPVTHTHPFATPRPLLHAEAERRYRQRRQQALAAFLTPSLICWVIWLAAAAGTGHFDFPWPVFVMLSGIRWVQLLTSREDTVADIEQELVRREEKRLAGLARREHRELERRRRLEGP